jgi:hypothetical protein
MLGNKSGGVQYQRRPQYIKPNILRNNSIAKEPLAQTQRIVALSRM